MGEEGAWKGLPRGFEAPLFLCRVLESVFVSESGSGAGGGTGAVLRATKRPELSGTQND